MVRVQIEEKGGQKSTYEFDKAEVSIGRMKGNDIVLPKGNVSKKHARIYDRNGTLMIDDLDSTNGTYVKGRKVTSEHEITENDKIYIGDFILQVQPEPKPSSGPPKAPPQPPGGGDDSRQSSPPSPPQPGEGAGNSASGNAPSSSADRPGSSEGSDSPLDSLDAKFGGGDDSTPSSQPRAEDREPVHQSGPADLRQDDRPSPPSDGNRGPRDARHSTGRDPAVQEREAPENPGPVSEGTPGAGSVESNPRAESSLGGADSDTPTPVPDQSAGRSTDSSRAPDPQTGPPERDPPVGRAEGQGRPSAESPPRSESVSERGQEAPGEREWTVPPESPAELDSEFDGDFHEAQRKVAEDLLDELDLERLPRVYPPPKGEREEYRELAREVAEEVAPAGVPTDRLVDALGPQIVGLGPLEEYIDAPEIHTVHVHRYDTVLLERREGLVLAERTFAHSVFLELAVERLGGEDDSSGIADRTELDGEIDVHLVRGATPSGDPVVTLRKPPESQPSLEDLVDGGTLSGPMATLLRRAVESGQSILIAGPNRTDRTTLLGVLGREVPNGSRTVAVEETSQLELPQPGSVRLQTGSEDGEALADVLDAAVEMRPDRILLDELRGAEAYTWTGAAATGTDGSIGGIHGLNAVDALDRLESLCLLERGDLNPRGIRDQIARAVDLVVTLQTSGDSGFRVGQITEVEGVDLDAFRLNDIFYFGRDGARGAFRPTGNIPVFYEDLRQIGRNVDLSIFRE